MKNGKNEIVLHDLGLTEYRGCLEFQEKMVAEKIKDPLNSDVLIFTEHQPVITLGKRGGEKFINRDDIFFTENKVDIVQTGRGGLVTCHMPGQAVLYPVLDLKNYGEGVKAYCFMLMDVITDFLNKFGVESYQSKEYPGVWVQGKKIGNIGLCVKKNIVFHGLSINISNDMTLFNLITPCGIKGALATRLVDEAEGINFETCKLALIDSFYSVFT